MNGNNSHIGDLEGMLGAQKTETPFEEGNLRSAIDFLDGVLPDENPEGFQALVNVLDKMETMIESLENDLNSDSSESVSQNDPNEASQGKEKKHVYEETVSSLTEDLADSGSRIRPYEVDQQLLKEMEKFEREITRRANKPKNLMEKISYNLRSYFEELNENPVYGLSDYELITEHRKVADKVITSFEKSKAEISKNYELLEKERSKSANCLNEEIGLYVSLEKELESIEENALLLEEKASKTNASDDRYAGVLHSLGTLKLERQKKSNQYEKVAHGIMNNKMALEEISDYQLAIAESVQTIDDAILHLERVNLQSFVSGTASSSLAHGETNLGVANEIVSSLSKMVSYSYSSINESLSRLNDRNLSIETKAESTDYVSDRSFYGEIKDLRKGLNQDVHKYVREMFEGNIIK